MSDKSDGSSPDGSACLPPNFALLSAQDLFDKASRGPGERLIAYARHIEFIWNQAAFPTSSKPLHDNYFLGLVEDITVRKNVSADCPNDFNGYVEQAGHHPRHVRRLVERSAETAEQVLKLLNAFPELASTPHIRWESSHNKKLVDELGSAAKELEKIGEDVNDHLPVDSPFRPVLSFKVTSHSLIDGRRATPRELLPSPALPVLEKPEEHPADKTKDGPEAGCRVWFGGKHIVIRGVVYKFIEFIWNREWASYQTIKQAVKPEVKDSSVGNWVHRAKGALDPLKLPWTLEDDSVNRQVRRVPRT